MWLEQCRQAKLTYAGQFFVYMNFQYDDGVIVREKISLGQLPIMLKVSDVIYNSLFLSLLSLPLIIPWMIDCSVDLSTYTSTISLLNKLIGFFFFFSALWVS